jgi:hypothetical protein
MMNMTPTTARHLSGPEDQQDIGVAENNMALAYI